MDVKEIGQRIKQERQRMGLTQFQLAEKAEISPQYMGKIERGEKKFSFETIVKISSVLNTSIDYLTYGQNERSESPELIEMSLLSHKLSNKEIALVNDFLRAMLVHRNREI